LQENEITQGDIDMVVNGKNGDEKSDAVYDEVLQPMFDGKTMISFKNESGEYPTASAIGLYKASAILKQKQPGTLTIGEEPIKWLLLYNHYQNIHHSIYLLRAC
jgi:hypothetical protein